MNAARIVSFILLISILLAPVDEAKAQGSENTEYFPETGHSVKGPFLHFYRSTANPKLIYGPPITEQFTSRDGKVVQYFQRARFELSGDGSVQLTSLGQATYDTGSQKLDINNPAACKSFQTGFSVCFAFLEFYEANGGEAQFGYPISPFEIHENLIVQYFERARFEWRADRPEGQRVVLTDLGRLYFDRLGEDPSPLKPFRPLDATISTILAIQARAFVRYAVTQASGQQTVFVVVQDQTNQPIAGANGKVIVHFSDGQTADYYFTTGRSGLGSFSFSFENQKKGELVPIDIVVTSQGLADRTTTSFRIWY